MVSRYLILSGIPLSRITICDEIQKMISYLVENLRPAKSNSNQVSNENLLHASATSSSSRTSFANQQRKSMMFTLKIYDKTANERHTLKYAGDKSISSIKRDVYSLTLIPDHRQIWTGWPSNYGERVRIFSRIYYFAF